MDLTIHWSWSTLFFYFFLGLIPVFVVGQLKKKSVNGNYSNTNFLVVSWVLLWSVVAAFRYISPYIGGSDTMGYIDFFQHCTDNYGDAQFMHVKDDLGFNWINIALYYVTGGNYRLFFLFLNIFMVLSFACTYKEFSPKYSVFVPYILTVFLFTRSFTSLRSNLAISILLFAFIALSKKKYIFALAIAVFSVLVHKMMVVYLGFFIVYPIIKFDKFGPFKMAAVFVLVFMGSAALRSYILPFIGLMNFEGSYESYLNEEKSFTEMWLIYFGQLVIGMIMIVFNKRLNNYLNQLSEKWRDKVSLVYTICIFDFLSVPLTGAMNIYRGNEVLYLFRIIMWGILLFMFTQKMPRSTKQFISTSALLMFMVWMGWRYARTYETSNLMPYFFAPFMSL